MIDVVTPSVFSRYKNIAAYFTKSNRNNSDLPVNTEMGINFGLTTTRPGDNVKYNYQLLMKQLGLKSENLALAKQVHGNEVKFISNGGFYPDTDGFITTSKNIYLGIQVADCAAILIADPENQIIGAFHAGWRGAINGILQIGLEKMVEEGGKPENFLSFLSPCISQKAFEVGEEVTKLFPKQFCDNKSNNKAHIDLSGYLKKQLTDFGIKQEKIELSNQCTYGDTDFFSFRREREGSGRMLALIGLK